MPTIYSHDCVAYSGSEDDIRKLLAHVVHKAVKVRLVRIDETTFTLLIWGWL